MKQYSRDAEGVKRTSEPKTTQGFNRRSIRNLAEKLEEEAVRLTEAVDGGDEMKEHEKFQQDYAQKRLEQLNNVVYVKIYRLFLN